MEHSSPGLAMDSPTTSNKYMPCIKLKNPLWAGKIGIGLRAK